LSVPFILGIARTFLGKRAVKSRKDLFEAFLSVSIERIHTTVDPKALVTALQHLAWAAMNVGRDTMSTEGIERTLVRLLPDYEPAKGRLVDRLVASGLLVSELEGRVRFIHRSILEYLSAQELSDRFLSGTLNLDSVLADRRWDNVLAWSVYFLPERRLSKLIHQIATWDRVLALRMADSAEVGRNSLLNAVLLYSHRKPPSLDAAAFRIGYAMSEIAFPAATQDRLRTIANHPGLLQGPAAAALAPHMTEQEIQEWIDRICTGSLGFNECQAVDQA